MVIKQLLHQDRDGQLVNFIKLGWLWFSDEISQFGYLTARCLSQISHPVVHVFCMFLVCSIQRYSELLACTLLLTPVVNAETK